MTREEKHQSQIDLWRGHYKTRMIDRKGINWSLMGNKEQSEHSNPYYWPKEEDLQEEICTHDWETMYLFTSSYSKCKKCGEEK